MIFLCRVGYARLDPNRMIEKEDVDQKVFVFFVERVEMSLRQKKDLGLLIGDRERESSASVARTLAFVTFTIERYNGRESSR